jgi:hypothetical protein
MRAAACVVALSLCAAMAQQTSGPPAKKPGAPQAPAQMKTRVFRGALIDATCLAPTVFGQPAPTQGTAEAATAQGSANRLMGDCALSPGSNMLGMKLDDGRMVRFDIVGNQRALDQLKINRRWRRNLAAGRTIHATVVGVISGDRLIVTLIH